MQVHDEWVEGERRPKALVVVVLTSEGKGWEDAAALPAHHRIG
jgi:hypothetical protein